MGKPLQHIIFLAGALLAHAQQAPDYARDIQPIFAKSCYACHNGARATGGIRLDARAGAFGKGDSGRVTIAPGDSGGSELVRRVSSSEKTTRMPLGGSPLSAEQIRLLRAWVDAGAAWPEGDREHWAFRPLRKSPSAASIDSFVRTALAANELSPAPAASREQLIRRLYFTVTGLPPQPRDIDAFLQDKSPNAYERLVDRLLAEPHYGERWGRHWLDIARYADSEGYNRDADRPQIYRYRDFVIRALNQDMPFDKFVRWQIAGDEYEPDNPDATAATGFIATGPREYPMVTDTEENKLQYIYDELDDIVGTTGQAMLGLTVGCARCHDHKFDPVPTRDYYRLTAAFRNFDRREAPLSRAHRELEQWLAVKKAALREQKIEAAGIPEDAKIALRVPLERNNSGQVFFYKKYDEKLRFTEEEFQSWLSPADRVTEERLKQAVAGAKEPPKGYVVVDSSAAPVDSYLLGRGSVRNKQEKVSFGFLTVLTRGREPEQYRALAARNDLNSTFQRSAVAEWLVDVEHGAGALLARVIVNRLWQHHFGEGIVRTPNDFGLQGERPTHPELLDWLAGELIRNGWRLKPIHRMILNSAAYRISDRHDEKSAGVDPENRLLWRRRPMRLEAETLRDSILSVSGSLNEKMYGPPVRPYIPPEATLTRSKEKWPADVKEGPETWRRTVYVFAKRSVRLPWLETFDAPDGNTSCGRRVMTTVPTQALMLINDAFVRSQAHRFADRVLAQAGNSRADRVKLAYRLALGRLPSSAELDAALTFAGADVQTGLVDLCHVLFTLNEFAFVD